MFSWVEKLFTGYSSEELQAESDRADRALAEQNQKAYERGAIDLPTYQETQDNIARGQINASAEIGGAFNEGLKEGVDSVRVTIGDVVTSPFKLIDWRLYLVGALVLFFYMGGAEFLKGILKKK
jgi:hypothetical protein